MTVRTAAVIIIETPMISMVMMILMKRMLLSTCSGHPDRALRSRVPVQVALGADAHRCRHLGKHHVSMIMINSMIMIMIMIMINSKNHEADFHENYREFRSQALLDCPLGLLNVLKILKVIEH